MSEDRPHEELHREVVSLEADKAFDVEFNGPSNAHTALIFVHGFGVRRDSRGLFTDIEQTVGKDILSIRGDFSDVSAGHTDAVPFSNQVARLKTILAYSQERFSPQKYIFVGHSQGAITVALSHPSGSKVVLLAPPVDSPFERFITTAGWSRPGSSLDVNGDSHLVRSDGSTTDVGSSFWKEFQDVNAVSLYRNLASNNEVTIIFAGADQVLGAQEVPEGLDSRSISGADHDFNGLARTTLLDILKQNPLLW
jgi:hypothetical protein